MNKWTLQFLNSPLEKQYQSTYFRKSNLIGLKFILTSNVALYLGKLIQDLQYDATTYWFFFLPSFLASLISCLTLFFLPNQTYKTIIILNYTLSLSQFWITEKFGVQKSFVLGQGIMGMEMILMMTFLDYKAIVLQVVTQGVAKLIILAFLDTVKIPLIILTIQVAISQVLIYYKFIEQQRKEFLLSIKEDFDLQFWKKYIENPYILFQFKENIFQPIQVGKVDGIKCWDSEYCEGCNLRFLLRYIKKGTQTLEQILLKGIQQKLAANECKMDDFIFSFPGFGKIKVLQISLDKLTFLIQFKHCKEDTIIQQLDYEKIRHFYRMIRRLFQYLNQPQKNNKKLFDISTFYISGLYQNSNKLSSFYPIQTLKSILKFISTEKIIFEYPNEIEEYNIGAFKSHFAVFFLQLFRVMAMINQKQGFQIIRIDLINNEYLLFEFSIMPQFKTIFIQLYSGNHFIKNLEHLVFQRKLENIQNMFFLRMKPDIGHQFRQLI